MRLGIISDVHANELALEASLAALERLDVDRLVILGDIVGYAANPAECLETIRQLGCPVVRGNHDEGAERADPDRAATLLGREILREMEKERHDPDRIDDRQQRDQGFEDVHGRLWGAAPDISAH